MSPEHPASLPSRAGLTHLVYLQRLGRAALTEACSGGQSTLTALPVFHEGKATRCLDSSTGEEASTLRRALPAIIAWTGYEMRSRLVRAKRLAWRAPFRAFPQSLELGSTHGPRKPKDTSEEPAVFRLVLLASLIPACALPSVF